MADMNPLDWLAFAGPPATRLVCPRCQAHEVRGIQPASEALARGDSIRLRRIGFVVGCLRCGCAFTVTAAGAFEPKAAKPATSAPRHAAAEDNGEPEPAEPKARLRWR